MHEYDKENQDKFKYLMYALCASKNVSFIRELRSVYGERDRGCCRDVFLTIYQ